MRILAAIGVLGILFVVLAAIYFFGGFYSVAATDADPEVVRWALIHLRTASIERHADEMPPMSLDDPATVQTGARASSQGSAASIATARLELIGRSSPKVFAPIHRT